ncbi:MAG: carboxypeptidase regulatory-like domain-containing protein [Gemmatimonadales bacterium]
MAGAILGTVRSGTSGLPVAGASIALDDVVGRPDGGYACTAWSDMTGLYMIAHAAPGTVTMQVSHPGYDTLRVQVTVAALGIMRLDVTLAPKLVVLDSVHVPGLASIRVPAIGEGVQAPNTWRWQGSPADAPASTGEPDVFRVLDGDPNVAMRPEWPAALMDRGGTAGQVLVRIDGLPLWNPVHAGGALAAITPDAVSSVTLHDGTMPAEFGDRLTAVVDIDTRGSAVGRSAGDAAIGPAAARALWTSPLAIGGAPGTVLLAGRVSDRGLSTLQPSAAGFRDQWADGIATASLASGPTSVRVEAIASSDRVAPNDALVHDGPIATHMRTPWQTQTVGMIWTQLLGDGARLASRLSTSAFSATVPGQLDLSAPSLASSVHQLEGSSQFVIRNMTLGAVVDVIALRYRVTPVGTVLGSSSPGSAASALGDDAARRPMLDLRGQPVLASAYADQGWGPSDGAWQITTGIRAAAMAGTTPRIEPRLGVILHIAAAVTASAGLARTHQFIQSLRDPDTPYGAQIGLDLPAAAGMDGIPIAQSDAATARMGAQLGTHARLTVDGYTRRMSGLAIVSPARADAFAVYGFNRGSGRITGGALELDGGAGRVQWQMAYGAGVTTERFDAIRYHPAGEIGQTLTAAAAVHLDRDTQLRVASWLAAERPPGTLDAPSEGRDGDDIGGSSGARDTDDNGGVTAAEPGDRDFSSARTSLPPYRRADIQLRRDWHTGPVGGRLSAFMTLANVFNHDNVATVFPGSLAAPPRAIVLLPRSLLAGVGWTF